MATIDGSLWIKTTPQTRYAPLHGDVDVDVCVIGAGITGLTAARLLGEQGRSVALLESRRICESTTGHTTAKITASHGLRYRHVERTFGPPVAARYAQVNTAAIQHMADVVQRLDIDCDWRVLPNYVFTEREHEADQMREEAEAAQRAGLAASFVTETPLPFDVVGAVRVADQAQFHPRRYLLAMAGSMSDAVSIYEHTRVTGVHGDEPCVVETSKGSRVRARHVIVATQLPILDRGMFFSKAHPYREHVVAVRAPSGSVPEGMFINTGSPTRSVRAATDELGPLLVITGEKHKPGEADDGEARYARLAAWAADRFGANEVAYRWAAQDYYSVDGLPYIGRLTRTSDRILVATGFSGWGMTWGTASAMLLAERIEGRLGELAEPFDAKRVALAASAPAFVREQVDVARHLLLDRLTAPSREPLENVARGEGRLFRRGAGVVAAYRDPDGDLHTVSAACSHLGCLVGFNSAERSWDCPCHGSRFDVDGRVLRGPAVRHLRPMQADESSRPHNADGVEGPSVR